MRKLRWLIILMGMVILVISGFQFYWLKDNYNREKKALEIRTNLLFRETVREMQDSLLQNKLRLVTADTTDSKSATHEFRNPKGRTRVGPAQPRAARVLKLLGQQMIADSLKNGKKAGVFISLNGKSSYSGIDSADKLRFVFDSMRPEDIKSMLVVNAGERPVLHTEIDTFKRHEKPRLVRDRSVSISTTLASDSSRNRFEQTNTIYFNDENGDRIIIRMDSLFNDSLPVDKLTKTFSQVLDQEKLSLPFTVSRKSGNLRNEEEVFIPGRAFRTSGGYELKLGNTASFLLKKISLPILFSCFLVGITIFSFVLLYRSLLRQHRLAQLKNDLISNITHELKTPIATVGVALEALKNFNAIDDAARTREYLDISLNEVQRLNLLVDKVLKLSIFERKEIELRKEWFNCEELALEIINSMKLQFEKYGANVSLQADGGNYLVEADKLHISSVLYNLLDNALKYSKEQPVITVRLQSKEQHLEIIVADNGIGIPSEYRKKVFDKFFRVPTGDTHNAKGYGLGLSYVAEVLKRHHGFITADSELGKGSTFTVFLPYKEQELIKFDDHREIRKKH